MKKAGNVIWGLVLIVVGVVLGVNALGVADIDIFFDGWWTLFIIVPCLSGLFNEKDKFGNLVGMLIGVVLLLCCQDILDFDLVWKLLFPAILILFGVSMIFKDVFNKNISEKINKLNDKLGDNGYCATFGSQKLNADNEEFKGSTLNAIFGGIDYDLSKAIIKGEQVINCTAIFGGIDIILPKDVKLKVKSTSIFGGVSDERKNESSDSKNIVYINSVCLFGGVEIK